MNSVKTWVNQNIEKKQFWTIIAAGAAVGLAAYGLRAGGFGKVATVVKGG